MYQLILVVHLDNASASKPLGVVCGKLSASFHIEKSTGQLKGSNKTGSRRRFSDSNIYKKILFNEKKSYLPFHAGEFSLFQGCRHVSLHELDALKHFHTLKNNYCMGKNKPGGCHFNHACQP